MSCGAVALTVRMSWPTPRTGHHQIPATQNKEFDKYKFQHEKHKEIDINLFSQFSTERVHVQRCNAVRKHVDICSVSYLSLSRLVSPDIGYFIFVRLAEL